MAVPAGALFPLHPEYHAAIVPAYQKHETIKHMSYGTLQSGIGASASAESKDL